MQKLYGLKFTSVTKVKILFPVKYHRQDVGVRTCFDTVTLALFAMGDSLPFLCLSLWEVLPQTYFGEKRNNFNKKRSVLSHVVVKVINPHMRHNVDR